MSNYNTGFYTVVLGIFEVIKIFWFDNLDVYRLLSVSVFEEYFLVTLNDLLMSP
jgi:hypothetical protein